MEMTDLAPNPEYAGRIKQLHAELVSLSAELNDPLDYNDPVASWKKADPNKKKSGH
jgi:hypothetical protein